MKGLKLVVASLVGLLVPHVALAQNCDSYRQQAQQHRQSAAQEEAAPTMRDQHRLAAQAYRNAAAKFDAKYQECLSGRGGGGGIESTSPGYGGSGSNNALENFYNQMNQYQSQQADQERRQADHNEFGYIREEQGSNRAEAERLRQLRDAQNAQDAEIWQKIGQQKQQAMKNIEFTGRLEESVLGRKLTPNEWAERFKNLDSVPDRSANGMRNQGVPVDPNACVDIEYTGKGQSICRATAKDVLKAGVPKEIEFPAPSQRVTPTDWSKRFGAPTASPSSAVSKPAPSPSALLDPRPAVQQNLSPAPDWSARFSTPTVPSLAEKESPEGDASDPGINTKQSLRDRVSSKINSVRDAVGATVGQVRQEMSLAGMCQRGRAASLYRKAYTDLSALEQRGIDVECAAAPVGDNATVRGRYEYGSSVVESSGKLLDEAGGEIANPNEP